MRVADLNRQLQEGSVCPRDIPDIDIDAAFFKHFGEPGRPRSWKYDIAQQKYIRFYCV